MIKINKIISVIFVSLFFLVKSYAEIKDSLFATVGDKAITRSDIVNEIKTILILNGQAFSESKRSEIEESAVQSIIRRTVKEIEIEKYNNLDFSKKDLDNELKTLAANVNMDIETLKNTFIANEVNWPDVKDQIKTELLWNSLIFKLYKNRISINQAEIEDQLELIQKNKFIEEYLISEIIVPLVSKEELESKIIQINKRIVEEGFKNVARDISISETALNGGDLGWVSENSISAEFKKKIMNTPIGNVSEPIILPKGILFFKVKDKRKTQKFENLEKAKDQLVNAEKLKILNMHSLSHYDNLRRSISINYF